MQMDAAADVAMETLFSATDEAMLAIGTVLLSLLAGRHTRITFDNLFFIIFSSFFFFLAGQIGYGVDAMEMIKADSFRNFKCSCGTVNVMQECIPTDGPTNPLYRLKELAKTLFKTGEEDDDEFSDALDGTEDGGEVVDDEVYHDTMSS